MSLEEERQLSAQIAVAQGKLRAIQQQNEKARVAALFTLEYYQKLVAAYDTIRAANLILQQAVGDAFAYKEVHGKMPWGVGCAFGACDDHTCSDDKPYCKYEVCEDSVRAALAHHLQKKG
jgi:hypothetical protein